MVRQIVHLDIPDFYAAIEELRHPEWRKRPFALAQKGARAVIQGVNSIARSEGIREGMFLSQALRMCRRLQTIPPDLPHYRKQHQCILERLGRFSPLVEGTLHGHYFIDLTGTRRLWGPAPDVACLLEKRVAAENGLHARVGLASNKLISRVAAHCIPPGDLSCIFPGGEMSFFAPLPVTFLPGIGSKTASLLNDFNIRRIGQLAALSAETLSGVFGRAAPRLLRIARGIDPTPVLPFRKAPRLNITHTMERDENDRERLEAVLFYQVEEAGWLLRLYNRYPKRFALEILYADGKTARNQYRLPPITSCIDYRLFQMILPAFRKLLHRRIAVRRMVLELFEFSMPLRQMSIFPWEEAEFQTGRKLQEAIDKIRNRFGRRALLWGRIQMHCGFVARENGQIVPLEKDGRESPL